MDTFELTCVAFLIFMAGVVAGSSLIWSLMVKF